MTTLNTTKRPIISIKYHRTLPIIVLCSAKHRHIPDNGMQESRLPFKRPSTAVVTENIPQHATDEDQLYGIFLRDNPDDEWQ